jgi:hypothetical protein
MSKRITQAVIALIALLTAAAAVAQTSVTYVEDFQSYGTQANPPGWIDNSVGNPKPEAGGLYKTWPDPLQPANVVYGTKQSSGKPDGNNPRIGTFSTYTAKTFAGKGRFEYRGRFIRTDSDSRIGFTFFSAYPDKDLYYLIGLWQTAAGPLTMQLFAFGGGAPAGTLDSNFTPEANRWYDFVIQADDVDGVTNIRARFWIDGTKEPSTFSINAHDSAALRLTAGHFGIWSAVKGDAYVDDVVAKSPVDHTAPVVTFINASTHAVLDASKLALFKGPGALQVRVKDDLSSATATAKLDGTAFDLGAPAAQPDGSILYTPASITVDGTHTLVVHAVDQPGNAGDATLQLLVDQLPPVVTLKANNSTFADGKIFDADVTITATVSDISTVTDVVTLDGVVSSLPASVAAEQVHNIVVTITDQVGWSTTVTRSFTIDKTAPVITITANGQELSAGAYFNAPVTLAWSVNDLTFDASHVTATLDGNPIASGALVSADAIHTLIVAATDKVQHTATVTRTFALDKTAPQVRLLANGKSFLDGMSFNGPVVFTAEVTDATPTTKQLTMDGAASALGTAITSEKIDHTIKLVVTNSANLAATLGPFHFAIDLTKPSMTLTESGQPFTDGLLFSRDLNFVVTASDNFTAAPVRKLFVDGLEFPLGAPVVEEQADHTVTATATDDAGNVTTIGPLRFTLDKSKPVVTITNAEDGNPFSAGALFAHAVRVRVRVTDITATTLAATLDGTSFDLGAGAPQSDGSILYTPAPISGDGLRTLRVVATDRLQHASDPAIALFTIDTTPPAITVTKPLQNAIVSSPSVIVQGGSDDATTMTVADFVITPDADKTFTAPGVLLLEGRNEIAITATDKAGNIGSSTLVINLDTRAPELTITAPVAYVCLAAMQINVAARAFDPHVSAVTVSLLPSTASPVAATLAADGSWTATLTAAAEGRYTLVAQAADSVGHIATTTLPLTVDTTAPVVQVTDGGSIVNHPTSIAFRAIDADSAAVSTATLNGQPYVSGATIAADGDYTFIVSARDCAGNTSAARTITFTVDTAAPSIGAMTPADGANVGSSSTVISGALNADDVASVIITGTSYSAAISGRTFTFAGVSLTEGTNRLTIKATDRAGNAGTKSYTLNVKSTAPVVDILESGAPIPAGALFNRPIAPVVRATDSAAIVTATLNSNAFTSGTTIAVDGAYTLRATASDAFAHTSAEATATFTIDTIAAIVNRDHRRRNSSAKTLIGNTPTEVR